jgi:FdhD protein
MEKEVALTTQDGEPASDQVAVEEPLQITVDGHPVAVVMRTPGDDADLVRGFLRSEGVTQHPGDLRNLDLDSKPNHAFVFLRDGVEWDVGRLSRNLFSASSCGICGKASIDSVLCEHPPVGDGPVIARDVLRDAPRQMREHQAVFARTGGLHACAWFTATGELRLLREDVGRHNAVDKVIGAAMAEGRPLDDGFLMVSGRLSFEIVQKALAARVSFLAAVSAPSSLAIEFAGRANQTLVGFLRPPRFNVYTHPQRIG